MVFIPDPHDRDARYALELDSVLVAFFREAEGLQSEREVVEVRQGGSAVVLHRIGPFAKGLFALIDGESDDESLYQWWVRSGEGAFLASTRRNGSVIYLDGFGEERMRWRFQLAQIVEWEGEAPRPGEASPYEIDRLVIAHEGLIAAPPR
ncbi:MAG: phage tail protein [Planctomycetota bacterium]|nr:MAG: phage tail protein [Planctomycetota bacterium]